MSSSGSPTFVDTLSERIREERHELATRWLNRLDATIPVPPEHIFPSTNLLDHIPELIDEIGRFVGTEEDDAAGNSFMIVKARELGTLRHKQQASVHQLLHEYELLRGILETFALEQTDQFEIAPAADVIRSLRRIHQAISILTRVTVDTFVEAYTRTLADQAAALERFNRLVSHELRQPLTALQAATPLLRSADGNRERVAGAIERNVERLVELIATITKVSAVRMNDGDPTAGQPISLTMIAQEAARQLRDSAAARQVQVRVQVDMPEVVLDSASLELMLTNLLSNAIKYSDPKKPHRFVEVKLGSQTESHCTIQVADNGVGMTREQRLKIFTPFYRAHASRDDELGVHGLGLGLTIVCDCARTLNANVSVDAAPEQGTTFTISLPTHPSST